MVVFKVRLMLFEHVFDEAISSELKILQLSESHFFDIFIIDKYLKNRIISFYYLRQS